MKSQTVSQERYENSDESMNWYRSETFSMETLATKSF